jgi:hypothetical protein
LSRNSGSSTTVKPGYAKKANLVRAVLPVAGREPIVKEENNAMCGKGASFVHRDACHGGGTTV